jgi:hypothetical protein
MYTIYCCYKFDHRKPRRRKALDPKCRWKIAGSQDKIMAAAAALEGVRDNRQAYALTFHLTDGHIDRVKREESASFLFDEFNRLAKRYLGQSPLFFLVVENHKAGRTHVHGAVAATPGQIEPFEVALEARFAKGLSMSYWGHNQPTDAKVMYDGARWGDYSAKFAEVTVDHLGTNDIYRISESLKPLARRAYEASRSRIPGGATATLPLIAPITT